MKKMDFILRNARGLHATPACLLVQTAMKFKSNVAITYGDKVVNAKNLVGVVALGCRFGDKIEIAAHGEDEVHVIVEMIDLIDRREFDEQGE